MGRAMKQEVSIHQILKRPKSKFPRSEQDIAADYFALRKAHNETKWVFSESRSIHNPASHCDIAWAGALATHYTNTYVDLNYRRQPSCPAAWRARRLKASPGACLCKRPRLG